MINFPPRPSTVDPEVADAIHAAVEAEAFETAAMIAVDRGLRGVCLICLRSNSVQVFVSNSWGTAPHTSTCQACRDNNFGELIAFEERRLRRAGLL